MTDRHDNENPLANAVRAAIERADGPEALARRDLAAENERRRDAAVRNLLATLADVRPAGRRHLTFPSGVQREDFFRFKAIVEAFKP